MAHMTFYGAVREVTGSMHLLTTETDRILLDCGLIQGRRKESEHRNRTLPFDPALLTNIVLSHAHIDHSGRIPLLTRKRFNGRIISTRPTADACQYLLRDSAHIQESDAEYLNYKTAKAFLTRLNQERSGKKGTKRIDSEIKGRLKEKNHRINVEAVDDILDTYRLERIKPLYTMEDAEDAVQYFDGYPYRHPIKIGQDITCTLYEAGHILGSAMSIISIEENGRVRRVGFTGDIGRFNKPILKDPTTRFSEEDRQIDLMLIESTYGNRKHEPVKDMKPALKNLLNETVDRGGSVLIPAFAYGRTQELLYLLHELYAAGDVPKIPVYVDSPLATKLTQVFGEHPETYDSQAHEDFLKKGKNPFQFGSLSFTASVEESMAVTRGTKPHIVIAGSGMCEGGRILHHLRYKIHNPLNTILIVGFMAANTLGRRIMELGMAYEQNNRKGDAPLVKFYNKTYPINAHVTSLGGFSAHGDKDEMIHFLKSSNLNIKKIAVVHGEEDQSLSFADALEKEGFSVRVPHLGETIDF